MTIELLYTSAAQGLKQGSRGFCTVVCTAGLPINLAQRLEALSGYRHRYQPGDHRRVRCVIAGSDEARMSIARGTVLDLTKPLGGSPESDATEAARGDAARSSICN